MNVLVTGSKGFIAKNLIVHLKERKTLNIFEYDKDMELSILETYCKEADFIYHLAGINRTLDDLEFMEGNFGFTADLLDILNKYNKKCPVMISSSIQASLSNPYGKSKKACEDLLISYSIQSRAKAYIYRLPNVFGKWCRPNYNSVIATFCHNIANNLPITVDDPDKVIHLVYIDDVVKELIHLLDTRPVKSEFFHEIGPVYSNTLGQISKLLSTFYEIRRKGMVPDLSDDFTKKLYSTYLSYLPEENFNYDLNMNIDNRGSFTEFIRTLSCGQISVNVTKPGIIKGNHYHHTKVEKFLVVSGSGVIRLKKLNSDHIIEYFVDSNHLQVVDIPVGYTHNIENLGNTDLITIIWCNEVFDPENPDTYYLEV
ncbi:UDP-2-acetamido-2,6-beta-L-arabino-hexul-4-ose reductase [Mobilisporobacter senegalensis]|uniref:UDP-2-acetamido-2,6-beta-L-arabino-hexul-4-ose reductase n=1 Tax=Mobilisporobacter senegalensis TaxID=1329262 RepID=A0A3N1XRF1_9FIRM|nr:capsular polysaccharide biosynthesis protein CapF [Mobilisporobacter senegalensis]ROR29239.1 UDP-2-acetamido-2,6-beta-L-arabino-hexul-4-ose reductase [Mobilisporobacter senegalensis]